MVYGQRCDVHPKRYLLGTATDGYPSSRRRHHWLAVWRRLPEEEKSKYHLGKGSRSRNAGGAISPILFIAFALKVYFDGNWNIAISTWTLNYVVGSIVTILIWGAAILVVPATVAFVWWIRREISNTV